MRSVLALVLACLLVALTAADPLACADGCADEPAGSTRAADGVPDCTICLGFVIPATAQAGPAPLIATPPPLPPLVRRGDVYRRLVDRPPRPA